MHKPRAAFRCGVVFALSLFVWVWPVTAHDVEHDPVVVIDSDMGIDDAVTLAMALQCPHIRIASVVACEGVAGREASVRMLGRMLDEFNRSDITLYAAANAASRPAPVFRAGAEQMVDKALRGTPRAFVPFTPKAYLDKRGTKTTVLALGPLTNLAAALQDDAVRNGIAAILVQGSPDPANNWNQQCDLQAAKAVRESGVPVKFIASGPAAAKPADWFDGAGPVGARTSVGEAVMERLFADARFHEHYRQGVLSQFTDELVLIACVHPNLFASSSVTESTSVAAFRPKGSNEIVEEMQEILAEGRQARERVVFVEGSLPDTILQPDVRLRKPGMMGKNGETEWFAQLLMNEMHEHLGSYSIIGVKMGLRAAELLNAPQHGMQVVSHSAAQPPVSCLNDGVIVATGSTPGRALFRHEPGPAGSTEVVFAYNGRQVALSLNPEYQKKIQATIQALLKVHTLEDDAYWDGVRRASLEIWENWHRRDLFDVVAR